MLDLTVSNPLKAGFAYPEEQILAALANAGAVTYQPEAQGLFAAREAVCAYYADHGLVVDPLDVFISCSTSEAYSWLFKLLANPGDTILAPQPSYPLFDDLVGLEGLRLRTYRAVLRECWEMEAEEFERLCLPSVRAILVVSPNNPTGAFLTSLDRDRLEQCGIPLIVDEVFADYGLNGFGPSMVGRHRAVNFVLSGLSKVCGLPNLKLSWIVTQGPEDRRVEIRRKLEWIADTYLSASTQVQQALPALLQVGRTIREQIRARLATNRATLAVSGLTVLPGDGGWYAILQLPGVYDDEEWALRLLEAGVQVHPGYFYDLEQESCAVVSLLPEPGVFRRAVDILQCLTR